MFDGVGHASYGQQYLLNPAATSAVGALHILAHA